MVTGFVGLGLGLGASSAGATGASLLSLPLLTITASGATTVGFQIFANSNLTQGAGPTGTITFRLFGPADGSCTSPIFTSTVPVSGTSMNSARFTTTAAGTYRWESTYNGDLANQAVGPTPCSAPGAAVVVEKARTYLAVTGSPLTAGTMHGTASVTGGYHPTGTVTYLLAPPGDTFCSATPVSTSTVAVNGIGSYDSANYAPTVSGSYKWRVSYSGDANSLAGTVTSCLDPNAAVTITVSPTTAAFTYPIDGQANVDTTRAFTWLTVPTAQSYVLVVGTTAFGSDLVITSLPPTQSSFTVTALPAGTIFATIYTQINGAWVYQAITFTAIPGEAALTSPTSGQTSIDPSQPFTWSTVSAAQGYYLFVGTTPGGGDVVDSGILPASGSSYTANAVPSGRTLYAVMYTEVNGAWNRYQVINFATR